MTTMQRFRQWLLSESHACGRLRLAVILYLAILIGGNLPGARAGVGQAASSFALHGWAYAGIAALLFSSRPRAQASRALFALLGVAAMGALDEGIQTCFPYRNASIQDWYVDVAAAAVVCAILSIYYPRHRPTTITG